MKKSEAIFLSIAGCILAAILIPFIYTRLSCSRMARDHLSENYSFAAEQTGFRYNFLEDIYYVEFTTKDLTPAVSFSVRIQHGKKAINTTFESEAAKLRLNAFFQEEASRLWENDSRVITNIDFLMTPAGNDIREEILNLPIEDILSFEMHSFSIKILLEGSCDEAHARSGLAEICRMLESRECPEFGIYVFFSPTGRDNDWYYDSYTTSNKEFHQNRASEKALEAFS